MEVIHTTTKNIAPLFRKMGNKRVATVLELEKTQNNLELKTQEIMLLSPNMYFYKTFTYNKELVSVYINVKEQEDYYLVLTINKNQYYIKMGSLDKIDNIEDFTQLLIQDINIDFVKNNVEQLNNDLINKLVRDIRKDIVYNPENPYSRLHNYPLFYFADSNNNIFIAFNKKLLDTKTINMFATKIVNGCLMFLSNSFNCCTLDFKTKQERLLFYLLFNKTWYEDKTLIETQGF